MAQTVKNPHAMWENLGLSPGSGRSPGEGRDKQLQFSCLENPVDRGAWWATLHRVAKSCKESDTTEVTEHTVLKFLFLILVKISWLASSKMQLTWDIVR